jgi:hypothetical protein
MVHLSVPRIRGDTATLVVGIAQQTRSDRQPVAQRAVRLILHRESGAWVVKDEEVLVVT